MLKNILLAAAAVAAISAVIPAATSAGAEEFKEFRIGLMGGEKRSDRLRTCSAWSIISSRSSGSRRSPSSGSDYDGRGSGDCSAARSTTRNSALRPYAKVYLENMDAVERSSPPCRPTVRPATIPSWWPARSPA